MGVIHGPIGLDPGAFVTEWTVGTGDTITLYCFVPWQATTNNYDVDWGDGNTESNITIEDKTHTYVSAGTYQVVITGQYDSLNMQRASASQKLMLTKMVQWGTDSKWHGISNMFYQASLMEYEATDAPDLSARWGYLLNSLGGVFFGCGSIVSLDLRHWEDIAGITSMGNFAGGCSDLELFDITGWDTSSVTNIGGIGSGMGTNTVSGCELKMPDLSFVLTRLDYVFNNGKFSSMDLSNWDIGATSKIMTACFNSVDGAFDLDLSGWTNTQSINNLTSTFYHSEFTTINMTGWDTSNVTSFSGTFSNIPNLTDVIGLNDFRANSATSCASLFNNCPNLSFNTHNLSNDFGTDLGNSCTNIHSMFDGSGNSLAPPNVTNFDTSLCTTFGNMFKSTDFNAPIDVSNWDTSALTGGGWYNGVFYMFGYSKGTTNFDLSNWDFSRLTDMTYWFIDSDADTIDLGATQDFSSTTNWSNAFKGLGNVSVNFLSTADISATALSSCFYNSTLLTTQYSNLLIALDTTSGSSGTLHGGDSQYSGAAAVAAKASLVAKFWTITDNGEL